MSKIKISLFDDGVSQLLKSSEIQNACLEQASAIASRAGSGYEAQKRQTSQRSGAAVVANTQEARRDNLKNNTLLKAIGR